MGQWTVAKPLVILPAVFYTHTRTSFDVSGVGGKCPETSTDIALKPVHVPRMLNIRDPLSENVAKAADHGDRQLYIEEPAQSAGLVVGSVGSPRRMADQCHRGTWKGAQNPLLTLTFSERSWESLAGVSASSKGVYTFTLRSGASKT